ncbi:MAG: PcfJ domain-containing protein [Firmicutes bacterium]|nr:PcfJ domain-containing protein [Bacillota bacterium]
MVYRTKRISKAAKISREEAHYAIMHEAHELPNNFKEWLNDKVFEKYMFFKKNDNGTYTGYCQCNAGGVEISRPRSGKYGECPACGANVRFKNVQYNQCYERQIVAYLQETSIGWMQRLFVSHKDTSYNAKTGVLVRIYNCEDQRDHINYDDNSKWNFHPYSRYCPDTKSYATKWLHGRGNIHGAGYYGWIAEDCPISTYPYNIERLFRGSKYKYFLTEKATENMKANMFRWLYMCLKYPQMELLIKAELYNLSLDFLKRSTVLNMNGKTPKEICGLATKEDIKFATKFNLNARQVRAYNYVKLWKKNEPSIPAIDFMDTYITHFGRNDTLPISEEKLYNYYLAQNGKYLPHNFIRDYLDYIRAVIYLKMNVDDTKVKTPNDFKYSHDIFIARAEELRRINLQKQEKNRKAKEKRNFKKLIAEYAKKLPYADSRFLIAVPATPKAIKEEGEMQGHCVGSYIGRVAKGTSIILFLRKTTKPEIPFYTIELSEEFQLVQCRGKGNIAMPENVEKWLNRYVKRIQNQMQCAN